MRVAVRDDGPGMPEVVRRHAFEPFLTTKAPGKGTGLGLAQIHGFGHQSGGTALVDSAPGRGTEVAILLPRAAGAVPAAAETGKAAEAEDEPGHGETVLVVEDGALVRGALAGTLRELRYRVVEAADADAALALLDGGAEVAAILSDVTMPGSMDGAGLADAARARLPGVPVVLATGHAGGWTGGRCRPAWACSGSRSAGVPSPPRSGAPSPGPGSRPRPDPALRQAGPSIGASRLRVRPLHQRLRRAAHRFGIAPHPSPPATPRGARRDRRRAAGRDRGVGGQMVR